jgi:hypothetical protein
VNRERLRLYFEIGGHLDRKLTDEKWGMSIIHRASVELRRAFPEMEGLSPRNLRRMRAFYRAYRPAPKSNAFGHHRWPNWIRPPGLSPPKACRGHTT